MKTKKCLLILFIFIMLGCISVNRKISFAEETYYMLSSKAQICINRSQKIVTGIQPNSEAKDIIQQFVISNSEVSIKIYNDNKELNPADNVATGMKLKVQKSNTVVEEYTIIIYGDVKCDGKINIFDIVTIVDHILEKNLLTNEELIAANSNRDTIGQINIFDIVTIVDHILEKKSIDQYDDTDNIAPNWNIISTSNTNSFNSSYAGKEHTVEITFKGTDANAITSTLQVPDIMVKVGETTVIPETKTLSNVRNITNEVQYTLTLAGIKGNGALTLVIPAGIIKDSEGNVNRQTILSTGITMQTPAVTSNIFSGSSSSFSAFEKSLVGATAWGSYKGGYLNMRPGAGSNTGNILTTIPNGTALKILETKNASDGKMWFKVTYNSKTGYVYADYTMVNLPDIIPSIYYNITNSSESIYKIGDMNISSVTEKNLYGWEDGVVPVNYIAAKKLQAAQTTALSKGYSLKIYDSYRPLSVSELLYSKCGAMYKSYPKWTGSYSLSWFIAKSSSHNQGGSLDLTIVNKTTGVELPMQTPMHMLDYRSATTMNNIHAKLLASLMTGAKFTTLKSEWWHFYGLSSSQSGSLAHCNFKPKKAQ